MATFRFVLSFDPALDHSAMNVREYAEKRDHSMVKALPGKRPVWYVGEDLTMESWMRIDSQQSIVDKAYLAVMFGLKAIELSEAEALRPVKDVDFGGGRVESVWSTEQMANLHARLGPKRIYEIGLHIYERAYLGNEESGSASFTLPQSSQDELARIARQSVAQTPTQSAT